VSGWLDSLPHQIPFRAASAASIIDDRNVEGWFVCTANDALPGGGLPASFMVIEAMAQLGGGLAFRGSRANGFLSAIDDASIDSPFAAGDRVHLRVQLEADFSGIFRFRGTASREGLEVARARFYLAAPDRS
jgi:hypothetical protein